MFPDTCRFVGKQFKCSIPVQGHVASILLLLKIYNLPINIRLIDRGPYGVHFDLIFSHKTVMNLIELFDSEPEDVIVKSGKTSLRSGAQPTFPGPWTYASGTRLWHRFATTGPPPVGPHSAPGERPITTLVIATPPLMLLKSVTVAYATRISSPHRAIHRRFITCGFILLCLCTSHLFYCDCLHHIYSIVFMHITFILLCLVHIIFISIVFMCITFILLCFVHITFISIVFMHITFIILCLVHITFICIVFMHITFILY